MKLKVSDITIDYDIQLKNRSVDNDTVASYVEGYSNGDNFPPLIVYQENGYNWLADGFHRIRAAQFLGFSEIEVEIRPGTKDDALIYAAEANVINGRPMSQAEKKEAGLRLLELLKPKNYSEVARRLRLQRSTVQKWDNELSVNNSTNVENSTNEIIFTSDQDNHSEPTPEVLIKRCPDCNRLYDGVKFPADCPYCWKKEHSFQGWTEGLPEMMGANAGQIEKGELEAETPTRMKPKTNYGGDTDSSHPMDRCQTPAYAIAPLLPYIDPSWTIWEPAAGEGYLARAMASEGRNVESSDILTGENFFEFEPTIWDCIVTNPPFSIKYDWLARCYELGKPFALLLPVETIGTQAAQRLFKQYGVEVIWLDKRVNFKMPYKGWEGSAAQFPVAWFTWGLSLGQQMIFEEIDKNG